MLFDTCVTSNDLATEINQSFDNDICDIGAPCTPQQSQVIDGVGQSSHDQIPITSRAMRTVSAATLDALARPSSRTRSTVQGSSANDARRS